MARTVFRPQLIEFLVAHEGMVVQIDNMMRALPEGASEGSVRSAMRKIIEDGTFQITTLAAGNSWRIESVTSAPIVKANPTSGNGDFDNREYGKARGPVNQIVGPFALLGKMADGAELVRHEPTGQLYTLKAL